MSEASLKDCAPDREPLDIPGLHPHLLQVNDQLTVTIILGLDRLALKTKR